MPQASRTDEVDTLQRVLSGGCLGKPGSRLEGATVLVTGAGGGIGCAISRTLADLGARLCLVGRTRQALEEAADGLRPVVVCPTDLTREDEVGALVGEIRRVFGDRIDVLVHCAGIYHSAPLEQADVEELDRQFRVNVQSPYRLTKALLPMLKVAQGDIVFVNSTQGLEAKANCGQYAVTQHALKAMADSLRDEVNVHGVRVLTLHVGRTATRRQEMIFRDEGRPYRPELLLQPQDVADVIAGCLALPRTAEVTSVTIRPMIKSY